jgi:hypothetical protein
MRTSLDYAWIALIEALQLPPTKWTKFPFSDTADALKRALHDRKIDAANPALFEFMLTEIKPYDGGNYFLVALHELDIFDKHRLLLAFDDYGAIEDMKIEDEYGNILTGSSFPTLSTRGKIEVHLRPNLKVKHHGNRTVEIVFDEALPLARCEVLGELRTLSNATSQCIGCLENFLPT